MKKIIFRGKLKLDGVWVYWNEYGELTTVTGKPRRQEIQYKPGQQTFYTHVHQIKSLLDRDTVGQYISRDKKQTPVFDGDLVSVDGESKALLLFSDEGELCWRNETFEAGKFAVVVDEGPLGLRRSEYLVIGNKWDNPELMENFK